MPGYVAVGFDAPDHVYAKRYADQTGLDLREVSVERAERQNAFAH